MMLLVHAPMCMNVFSRGWKRMVVFCGKCHYLFWLLCDTVRYSRRVTAAFPRWLTIKYVLSDITFHLHVLF